MKITALLLKTAFVITTSIISGLITKKLETMETNLLWTILPIGVGILVFVLLGAILYAIEFHKRLDPNVNLSKIPENEHYKYLKVILEKEREKFEFRFKEINDKIIELTRQKEDKKNRTD